MKKLTLLLLLIAGAWGFDFEALPHYSTTYDAAANPHIALEQALKRADKAGKNVLLMVGGDWCRWCGTLDNFFDDHPGIAEDFYTTFEVVRVYYGKGINAQTKSLLRQFPPLKGTPHFYILDSHAKLLESIDTGYLERGYGYNRRKVTAFIRQHRKTTPKTKETK